MTALDMAAAVPPTTPALGSAQTKAARPAQMAGALLERMKTNVAAISASTEKDRWQANLELWQRKLGLTVVATKADLDPVKLLLDRLFTNVATITDPNEKERWDANMNMWKIVTAHAAKVPRNELEKIRGSFDDMRVNLTKIADAKEKERWLANRDLWRAQIRSLDAALCGGSRFFASS